MEESCSYSNTIDGICGGFTRQVVELSALGSKSLNAHTNTREPLQSGDLVLIFDLSLTIYEFGLVLSVTRINTDKTDRDPFRYHILWREGMISKLIRLDPDYLIQRL